MSNKNSATVLGGLKAVSKSGDMGLIGAATPMEAPSSYGVDLFEGDPVIRVAAGSNTVPLNAIPGHVGGANGYPIGALPEVNIAAAGATNRITGVISGFGYDPSKKDERYGKASTQRLVLVYTDPFIEYEAAVDGSAAITSAPAQVGANANLVAGSGGDTTYGISSWGINHTGLGTVDATYQLLVMAVTTDPYRNDTTAANPTYVVCINLLTNMSTAIAGI